MQTTQYITQILHELNGLPHLVSLEDTDRLISAILAAERVFTAGAGRSGLMGKAFAMRMMHLGLQAYVVGESVTPNLARGDLLVIGSGSGGTKTLVAMAEKAKSLDASVTLVTVMPQSAIGQLADFTVKLPGSPKESSGSDSTTIQPMGSLFEQSLLLFYDAVVLTLMEKQGIDAETMFCKHANLE